MAFPPNFTKKEGENKMKKVLIAVDETSRSKAILSVFNNMMRPPEEVVLLHVQRLEGRSLMIDMLSDAELSTLNESMEGTEHKEALDKKAGEILSYFRKELESIGLIGIKTVVRQGRPVDEILAVAREEGVDLIITGCTRKTAMDKLITGNVSRDVEKNAGVPVLIANDGAGKKGYSVKETKLKFGKLINSEIKN